MREPREIGTEVATHGAPPYRAAVLHGGPGAPGSATRLAEELGAFCGVLEPWQSGFSIEDLLVGLHADLQCAGCPPMTLVGHSWGAWLGWMFAARYPELVAKLVLVGSGPFQPKYAEGIMETRLLRLSLDERGEARKLMAALGADAIDADGLLRRLGRLMEQADGYDLLPERGEQGVRCDLKQFDALWTEGDALRRSGELLALGKNISCPVLAVQGAYDPHGSAGVRDPLGRALDDFEFLELPCCGHSPWKERLAREAFLKRMQRELA